LPTFKARLPSDGAGFSLPADDFWEWFQLFTLRTFNFN